ncbi:3-oxo-tetronate kinase [Pseudoclavibacter helvolus]|uniref:3-oxo-tetronate kinase n=1 Tax=Pseudoclavibacter helvolus TaxID=255205 RepID=UPI0037353786
MAVRLGVIADDFTGGTDIAGFLVANGLRTVQLTGVPAPSTTVPADTDAVVISLKSRSIPAKEAVSVSLAALRFLQGQGAERFYFKYCSTFDSTPAGNIGPVTDALLGALGEDFTVICPALPVNGRTTYRGYLFVEDVPLHESGMRNHPITPMTDSNLMRLMDGQAEGRTGNVQAAVVTQGAAAVREALAALHTEGYRYAVLDAITNADLDVLGEAVADHTLVTGGSGLAAGLARALSGTAGERTSPWHEREGRTVVLSGSSSVMTNQQVAVYRETAPFLAVNVDQLVAAPDAYREQVLQWVLAQPADGLAPLVSATAPPEEVSRLQDAYGAHEVSEAIESMFGWLASALAEEGVQRFIVAGGETSGAVTTALNVTGFEVGPQIAPGVPWVRSISSGIDLALKSGNFGDVDFFSLAQTPHP